MQANILNEQEVALINQSFSKVLPIAEVAAELFYKRLFEINPAAQSLFKGDMKEQGRKLMHTIGVAVASARRPQVLVGPLTSLAERHKTYGVKPEQFDDVGAALLWTLEQGLGPDFTPQTRAAWAKLYGGIVDVMLPVFEPAPATVVPATQTGHAAAPQRPKGAAPSLWGRLRAWLSGARS